MGRLMNEALTRRSVFLCRLFWLRVVPVILTTSLLLIFILLRYGNPQWSKHIYMFQVFVWEVEGVREEQGMKLLPVPKNYSGVWCVWYENGQMMDRLNYEHKEGVTMEFWYESGQKGFETRRQGEIVTTTSWYRNGKKSSRRSRKKGRYFGRVFSWSTNEELVASGTYRNGNPWNGTFRESRTRKLKTYKNGKCIKTEEIADKFEFNDE